MLMEIILAVQYEGKVTQRVTMRDRMRSLTLRREGEDKLIEKNKNLELSKNGEALQQF